MNVLIVGGGKGSWQIRGVQLGAAIGARVTSQPSVADWRWATVVVLVKNYGARFAPQAHAAHVPIVWDALDFWKQPADNQADERRARAMLQAQINSIKPALVIGATQAMAEACGGVYLPHHAWAGLTPTPARETVQVVAYQGNVHYLGAWTRPIAHACQARGWSFVVNPPSLSAADLLVAFREGIWDGWICRNWKSGVKIVNAIAAGRPIITQSSAAARELTVFGSIVETVADLHDAFDEWADHRFRVKAVSMAQSQAPKYALTTVAERYLPILQSVEVSCAA